MHLSDASLAKSSYQEMVYKWFNGKESKPLTKLDCNNFLKIIKTKNLISQFLGMTKYLTGELESKSLVFKKSPKFIEIKDFLTESRNKILVLTTPNSLTVLGSIFVLQGIKDLNSKQGHFLFMKTSSFNTHKDEFLQCITDNSIKFLIFEVDNDVDYIEISKIINKNRNPPTTVLKIIFIASENLNHTPNLVIKISDGNSLFLILTKNSQDKLLQRSVNFQGKYVEVKKIVNKFVEVDNGILCKLINNREITISDAIIRTIKKDSVKKSTT